MTRLMWILSAVLLCTLVVGDGTAWGAGELTISCDGSRSGGGGMRAYQYTLKNNGAAPVTLTMFYLGTLDLAPGAYSNWIAPAGFAPAATVADWTTLFGLFQTSIMGTTMIKTPHGLVPPPFTIQSFGGIVWTGSAVVNPGQTVTFGFDNSRVPWDMEWFAEHPDAVNSSQASLFQPIAGPIGVYTQGYVHGPGEGAVPSEGATFGRIKALYSTGE
ncbi:MAG: hypothetical protein H6Q78_661 [Candidatus Krumholzibacteriota bacterium]|nr:hypothetical protein [Candidatus Krumholzibacteriota bacterium]